MSYVCIEQEIDPIAQQSVFKFLEDHALPFTWIEKIVVEIVQFNQCFIEYCAIKYQDPCSTGCRGCSLTRGLRYYMDPQAFEKFENAIFFKIFKIPSNGQLV